MFECIKGNVFDTIGTNGIERVVSRSISTVADLNDVSVADLHEQRKGHNMYASVRQYTIPPDQSVVNEAARDVQGGVGPLLSQAPGFIAYYVLDAGNDNIVAISIFESKEAEEKAEALVSGWIRQHMAGLSSSPPRIAEGEVIAHEAK
jgi:heme-degrading monooxygenase HmoA